MPPLNEFLRRQTQAAVSSVNSHRIILYTLASTLALLAVVANALKSHSNFFSVCIYLAKSNRSVLIFANFTVLVTLLVGHVVQKIFFGALRANEVERLYDRLWFFVTESLLAFTIFRDEFDFTFALMFGFLLFVKCFHWLASDRMEWMDQRPYPGPPLLFHIRISVLFVLLWITDMVMFSVAVKSTVDNGVGGMILFATEYGILVASIGNTVSKYLLSVYEFRRAGQRGGENAPPWENKSMWTFYIDLTSDFLKLTIYLVFFTIIIKLHGLPLNIVRDVYLTARSFITRLRSLHRYQAATRNMDQRYPNATEEEMNAMSDRTCIICREEMILPTAGQEGEAPVVEGPNTTPKKLPCGHIFHFHCLRSWLERQQSCPTCRRTVLDSAPPAAPAVAGPRMPDPFGQNMPAHANNIAGNPNGLDAAGRLFAPLQQAPAGNPNGLGAGGLFAPLQPGPPVPQVGFGGHVQNAPNVPQAQIVQNAAGQPTMVIQYQLPYQLPYPTVEPAVLPLQPPPQFPGFRDPDGVWHPWLPAQRNDASEPVPPVLSQNATLGPSEHATQPQANTDVNSGTSSTHPDAQSMPPANVASPSEAAESEGSSSPTPREAAALAALRRLGGPQSTQETVRAEGVTRPSQSSSTPAQSDANVPIIPTSSLSTQAPPRSQTDLPKLIPLYNFPNVAGSSTAQQAFAPPFVSLSHRATATRSSRGQPRLEPRHTPQLSQLPATLTEEQLATMDQLTREAIDERLRVLEGVSSAVNRCVDELLRMRSVLPTSNPVQSSSPTVEPMGLPSSSNATGPGSSTLPVQAPSHSPRPASPAPSDSNVSIIAQEDAT